MEKELKIAVLIDAENVSSKYVNLILQEANALGNVIYKRIYGNWTTPLLNSWKNELLDNAIQPIQQYSNTSGKNSSDSALIIDAMDLLYQKNLDAFCIVSSDSDFTRLASRLRESEKIVVGMGEQKTPRAFISACNKFAYLDLLFKQAQQAASGAKPKRARKAKTQDTVDERAEERRVQDKNKQRKRNDAQEPLENETPQNEAVDAMHEAGFGDGSDIFAVEQALREIAEEFSRDDGWIFSASLGAHLSKRLPDFDTRNFGFRKFVPFVESLNIFEEKSTADEKQDGVRVVYFRLIEE